MTSLQHQIRRAQHRLWLNRWFHQVSCCVAIGAVVFAAVVLVQRLFDIPLPLFGIGIALGFGAVIASVIWVAATRDDAVCAAAMLDQAAGLRERISSGHLCSDSEDPFAKAVVADADRVSAAITVKRHIRLKAPRPLPWTTGAVVLAAMMFLITPGLLTPSEATQENLQSELVEQTRAVVKRKLDAVRKLAEDNSALGDLQDELSQLEKQSGGMLRRPNDIRHEAVKKIDRLADAVKKKRDSRKYDKISAARKMMRRLDVPRSSSEPTQKLSKALQQGDFKTAKEELKTLQEQLATLKSDEDKELVVKLSKQLDELSKKLEKMSVDKKLAQQLEQAGIKKEDLDRMLANLKKKDLDQLKQQLQQKGMNQQQIDKLTKQLQTQQQGCKCAKQMAKGMRKAAQAAAAGQMGDAAGGLAQAGQQLSELEQLEQEMNQLDSTMADLQDARNDLDNPCPSCKGTGMVGGRPCGQCGRRGAGMGKLGRGRGGLAPEAETDVAFKTERAKVHTGKGAIIGQFLVDGEQVKGEVGSSLQEIVTAAEHDASDRINRNRIPRQYQKAVKAYFSNVQEKVKEDGAVVEPVGKKDD